MKKYFLPAALALIGSLMGVSTSQAQSTVVTNPYGDLVLSFRASGGVGATTNLEIDLGPFTNFTSLSAGQVLNLTGSTGLQISDLANAANGYGSNWASRSDVFWSAAATTYTQNVSGNVAETLYITGAVGSPFQVDIANNQKKAAIPIYSMANGLSNGVKTADASVNGASGSSRAAYIPTSDPNSYTSRSTASSPYFGYFDANIEGTTNVSSSPSVLALYKLTPSNSGADAVTVGTFSLTSSGLTFTAAPEPGSVMLLGVSGLTLLFRRRRAVQA